MNVLVLGKSGMLGSMVYKYLSNHTDFNVCGTVRDPKYQEDNVYLFNANEISQLNSSVFKNSDFDYFINCIGITKPFCKDDDPAGIKRAIAINAKFPWELASYASKKNIKVIQIATDCVYSGKKGKYNEEDPHDPLDVYGKSKSLGEVIDKSTLLIRNSIIGPEIKEQKSFLLEWFLGQEKGGTIGGYEHHIWNGITTLQFAQLCQKIINNNVFDDLHSLSPLHHYVPNSTVNKYELMHIFNDVFKQELTINRVNIPEEKIDRSLSTKYSMLENFTQKLDMKTAIQDLKNYIEKN